MATFDYRSKIGLVGNSLKNTVVLYGAQLTGRTGARATVKN